MGSNQKLLLVTGTIFISLFFYQNCGHGDSAGMPTQGNGDGYTGVARDLASEGNGDGYTGINHRGFAEVVAPGSVAQGTIKLPDFAGSQQVRVSGFDSQISYDGINWSTALMATRDSNIRIRMTADPGGFDRKAVVQVAGESVEWIVSTGR